MDDLKQTFIHVLAESGALLTGRQFELKNGHHSDHFVDFGAVPDGHHLQQMGACFAEKIAQSVRLDGFDVVLGPAYKGIPIATAVVMAIHQEFGVSKRYAFNRKVEKTHGEGGEMLGSRILPTDRILIVDDVFTDGGAKLETLELLRHLGSPTVASVIVGVDRAEPGAMQRFADQTGTYQPGGVPVLSICTIAEALSAVAKSPALQSSTLQHGG